jgi:hypothetical protein
MLNHDKLNVMIYSIIWFNIWTKLFGISGMAIDGESHPLNIHWFILVFPWEA